MDTSSDAAPSLTSYGAYGSNMNRSQMQVRTQGEAQPMGSGLLHDWQLDFRRGVLTISPAAGAVVPLAFWHISPHARRALDHYEGAPFLYRPLQFNSTNVVRLEGVLPQEFLIYEMTAEGIRQIDRPDCPGSTYYDTCTRGYVDFGMEEWLWVLEAARERSISCCT